MIQYDITVALTSKHPLANVGMEGAERTPTLFQVFVVGHWELRVDSQLDAGQEGGGEQLRNDQTL